MVRIQAKILVTERLAKRGQDPLISPKWDWGSSSQPPRDEGLGKFNNIATFPQTAPMMLDPHGFALKRHLLEEKVVSYSYKEAKTHVSLQYGIRFPHHSPSRDEGLGKLSSMATFPHREARQEVLSALGQTCRVSPLKGIEPNYDSSQFDSYPERMLVMTVELAFSDAGLKKGISRIAFSI
ncbi:hypothetical protein CRG98_047394 [Punica granatum]|uniref:Uncharacterized protein n=1 Tax=Punica granatum TaxID=22663 RepID=A0A2I0HKV8_PUNGR|nr:hypothetical protein CRG98_047394 [Punica granatum]